MFPYDGRWANRGCAWNGDLQAKSRTHTIGQNGSIADCHSTTLSARCSNDGGIVRPSALAVLMLMTSSSLDDCSTGKSAGFAPFQDLVYVASGAPKVVSDVGGIGNEASGSDKLAQWVR